MKINLNAIGVEKKSADFTQIYNKPIQKELKDLAAIGLLTYIISLPDDWTIYKTQLYKTFSRRKVESAWEILVKKGYAIDVSFYVTGKKGKMHFYRVSDAAFTQEKFSSLLKTVIKAVEESGQEVNLSTIETLNSFDLPEEIFNVQNVQYKMCSTKRTSTNKELTNKHKTNKHKPLLSIDNYQDDIKSTVDISATSKEKAEDPETIFTDACNEFYSTFAIGRWSKKQWDILVKAFVSETIEAGRHKKIPSDKIKGYCYKAFETIAENGSYKKFKNEEMFVAWAENDSKRREQVLQTMLAPHEESENQSEQGAKRPPFYDWLEIRD